MRKDSISPKKGSHHLIIADYDEVNEFNKLGVSNGNWGDDDDNGLG